jgi:hypothetical protein
MVVKDSVFWDITPCSPMKVIRRFGGTWRLQALLFFSCFLLVSCLVYSSTLKMDCWLATDCTELYPIWRNSSILVLYYFVVDSLWILTQINSSSPWMRDQTITISQRLHEKWLKFISEFRVSKSKYVILCSGVINRWFQFFKIKL